MDDSSIEVSLCPTPKKEEPLNDEKDLEGASGCSSPEANCPICLGKLENKSFTDSCLHQFCFNCLEQWSKVKAECPLCKQSFKSIIHTVRSIEDYEQHFVEGAQNRVLNVITYSESFPPREPFRYRTTAVSSYLDYVLRLEQAISHRVIPPMPTHSASTHWQRRRQNGTSDFRRNIYQQGLWVQGMRDCPNQYRESSPEFYRENPALVHRLVPWLNRELNVLCGGSGTRVDTIVSRVMDLIMEMPIRSSAFAGAISQYTGRHTEHFVHEFYSFATCALDMIGYDRHASYVSRNDLAHTPISDPSDDSDVQIVGPSPTNSNHHSIHLDSDSDECVVVESMPARAPVPVPSSPEVITLESDTDDVVQVNIHIPGPSRTRRPPLKRNWLIKNVKSSNDNVNVSINIAHTSRSRSRSHSSSSSSSSHSSDSWNPCNPCRKKPARTKFKKEKIKKKKSGKGKCLKSSVNGKDTKGKIKLEPAHDSNREDSPVVMPRRRRPSIVLKSSSDDDDSNVLHIVSNDNYTSSSDDSDYKPRLRSVVVKSSVKQERSIVISPQHSPTAPSPISDNYYSQSSHRTICNYSDLESEHWSDNAWSYRSNPSSCRYNRSYSSSSERPSKRSKYSDSRSKKDCK